MNGYVNAKLNVPATSYTLNLYDADHNLLQTAQGAPLNGRITASWDMTDENGDLIGEGPFECDFAFDGPGGTAAAKAIYPPTSHIKGKAFVVTYGNVLSPNVQQVVARGVVDVLRAGEGFQQLDYDLLPKDANVPYADKAFEWSKGRKDILRNALKDRNAGSFYWNGHGTPSAIYPSRTYYETLQAQLVLTDLRNGIHDTKNKPVNSHPYRLVILDACSTYSEGWADAFGIPFLENSSKDAFRAKSLDYSAYVGFNKDTSGPYTAEAGNYYKQALLALFGGWPNQAPLGTCMKAYLAQLQAPNARDLFSNYETYRIAGCVDLSINDR